MTCQILNVPIGLGAGRDGCQFGPAALREAGLLRAIANLGIRTLDLGTVAPGAGDAAPHPNPAVKALPQIAAWTRAIAAAAYTAGQGAANGTTIFLGGDHSLSAGTLSGLARVAAEAGRPLFVLWLDAHPDFHTLETTTSGNLHGVPLAYVSGQPGFAGYLPPLAARIDPSRICMIGTRSVDPGERAALQEAGVCVHDMAAVADRGAAALARAFLDRVAAENGLLHVSLDVDVLDPSVAPAVGTAVAGGIGLDEARDVMAVLYESGLVGSLDLVELNPLLDPDGRTASVMVDLAARLLGRGARSQRRSA
jgi:arginase